MTDPRSDRAVAPQHATGGRGGGAASTGGGRPDAAVARARGSSTGHTGAVRPEAKRAGGPKGIQPRSVTPGLETQEGENGLPEPGIEVGLDWIRCTGPEPLRFELVDFIETMTGEECRGSNGAKWYKQGLVWEPGIRLSWGHRSEICQVDFSGERLRMINGDMRVDLLRDLLARRLKVTRLDCAIDFIGQRLMLYRSARRSCRKGELCILRTFDVQEGFDVGQQPKRLQLTLGSRESSVCGRIYDKGLEQGVALPGEWERLEIEFKKARAHTAAVMLLDSCQPWTRELAAMILSAVDFREENGRSELSRRPHVLWWETLVKSKPVIRVPGAKRNESFEAWLRWFRSAAGPRVLEMAEAAGAPLGVVMEFLLQDLLAGTAGGPIVEQFRHAYSASNMSMALGQMAGSSTA